MLPLWVSRLPFRPSSAWPNAEAHITLSSSATLVRNLLGHLSKRGLMLDGPRSRSVSYGVSSNMTPLPFNPPTYVVP